MIKITVPGRAVAQSRPRLTTRGGHPHVYDEPKARDYKAYVKRCAAEKYDGEPMAGGVLLTIEEMRAVPKSWPAARKSSALRGIEHEWPGKPDIDNVVKAIMDALTGVLWSDDSQVVRIEASKKYGPEDCVKITVDEPGKRDDER